MLFAFRRTFRWLVTPRSVRPPPSQECLFQRSSDLPEGGRFGVVRHSSRTEGHTFLHKAVSPTWERSIYPDPGFSRQGGKSRSKRTCREWPQRSQCNRLKAVPSQSPSDKTVAMVLTCELSFVGSSHFLSALPFGKGLFSEPSLKTPVATPQGPSSPFSAGNYSLTESSDFKFLTLGKNANCTWKNSSWNLRS